jgi:ABC-type phosphate transport system substrate-binding protein
MKQLPHSRLAILAAAFGLALLAAPAARAFTMDNQSNVSPNGGARYTDPDEQFSGAGSNNGQSVYKQGNTTFHFGSQQNFDQRYNSDRMFDTLGGPGRDGYR